MPSALRLRDLWEDLYRGSVLASALVPPPVRRRLLNRSGARIGQAWIMPRVFFGGWDITIGDDTFVNHECFLDNKATITIGNRCSLGMQVMILTSDHALGGHDQRAGAEASGLAVTIGDGCWLGARATVLPGVTIADGCVIGAGAVVTSDTEPDGLYLGNPAKRVRDLPAD